MDLPPNPSRQQIRAYVTRSVNNLDLFVARGGNAEQFRLDEADKLEHFLSFYSEDERARVLNIYLEELGALAEERKAGVAKYEANAIALGQVIGTLIAAALAIALLASIFGG